MQAVYNIVRSNFRELGIPEQRLKTQTVAVHLVKIAEPKDGPSAGLAFVVGIVSALTNRPIKPGFAFTGEVALHGEVGPVDGLLHKIPPRPRAGRKHVIIPAANAPVIARAAGRREGGGRGASRGDDARGVGVGVTGVARFRGSENALQ